MRCHNTDNLVGAKTNMTNMNVLMRIFKAARRRGDTGIMERAMGFAGDFADKAEAYEKVIEKCQAQTA